MRRTLEALREQLMRRRHRPIPGSAVRRQNPTWEPSAVTLLAGIYAGGGPNRQARPSLPQLEAVVEITLDLRGFDVPRLSTFDAEALVEQRAVHALDEAVDGASRGRGDRSAERVGLFVECDSRDSRRLE
jgi:hypothetical protein